MEIRDLQYFCLTAELEHVTKAADKLGVAQPFLTKIIGQLETEVGVPLFDNIGRKIKLNPYGEVFYAHAKKILMELDNLRNDMDELIERNTHTIKIYTNIELHYPEIVMKYQEYNPDIKLAIFNASREETLNALKTGEADFGLCSPPLNDDDSGKGIKTEVIFHEQCCAMLPPGHPMLSRKSISFDDMVGDSMVTTSKESGLRLNLEQLMAKYSYHPNIVCESNDINLLIRAVKSGLGFAVLPRSVMFSIPSIRKYCVESTYPDTIGIVGLSFSPLQSDIRDSSGFIKFVKEFISNYNDNVYCKD